MKHDEDQLNAIRNVLREEIRPLESKVEHHAGRLDAHDSALKNHTDQLLAHSSMLTKHAEMHTQHAERIIYAQEMARQAKEASTTIASESSEAMAALGRHVTAANKRQDEKLNMVLASGAKAEAQRALQTAALTKLVAWQETRWFRVLVVVGVLVGGAVAGYTAARSSAAVKLLTP